MAKGNFKELVNKCKIALEQTEIDLEIKAEPLAFVLQGYGSIQNSSEEICVTFSELKSAEVGDFWIAGGSGEFVNEEGAEIIFKDTYGCLVRHGHKDHDEEEFNFHLKYYEFKTHNIKWHN